MKCSVAIISKTEKIDHLVLESLKFAEEIIVVVDAKPQEAKIKGKIHYYYHPLENDYSSQRNLAIAKTSQKWILFVDSDEYVSTQLRKEIVSLNSNTSYSGFLIRRIDVCSHQALLHGETGHTKIIRLAKKGSGKFSRPVHEIWKIKGRIGELESPLYHNKDNFVSDFIGRMTHYSDIDSTALSRENKPFTIWRLLLNPKGKFIQNYFFHSGYLDGMAGLFLAYLMSVQSLTVRIYQWTKRN